MCSLQRNICKTTDRNRRDYSGIYELTRGDQRGRRRRRALDWKTLLLHHLLNPCLLFLSSLDISSSLSLFHPPPLLGLLTDIQARYKKTVVSSPPLLPPSFCLSEVNFPLLFSLFSPEKKKKSVWKHQRAQKLHQTEHDRRRNKAAETRRRKHACLCVFLTGRMGTSCCDPLDVLLFYFGGAASLPSPLLHAAVAPQIPSAATVLLCLCK